MTDSELINELQNIYPDIKWSVEKPSDEVIKDYGKGIILRGEFDAAEKEFFILAEDQNKVRWGTVIAHNLFGMEPKEK